MNLAPVQKELKSYLHAVLKSGLVLARTMTESQMPGSACRLLIKMAPKYDRVLGVSGRNRIQLSLSQWQTERWACRNSTEQTGGEQKKTD